jgi:hypothetical protein
MDVTNITMGKPAVGGAIFRAPLGSTLPSDAVNSLDAAFVDVGDISEDGLTNSINVETTTVKDWYGDDVLVIQTSKQETYKFTMLESMGVEALKVIFGDNNVTGTLATGITVRRNSEELEAASWAIDMIGRDNTARRLVIPNAKVSDIGDIQYVGTDAVKFEITLTAMKGDSNFNYDTSKEYIIKTGNSGSGS